MKFLLSITLSALLAVSVQAECECGETRVAMIDAAGWIAKSNDYDARCPPVELEIGQTIIQYIDGVATHVKVESIEKYKLSDVSDDPYLYNIYLDGGDSIIANGIVLGEPSKNHMKQWYNDASKLTDNTDITITENDVNLVQSETQSITISDVSAHYEL